MKSKTSFFNKTVLLKDITRFFPVWALYLIGAMLLATDGMGDPAYFSMNARDLAQTTAPLATLNFVYALISAQMLFGDLFNSRLCNALHAMPLRRESWFLTHSLAGLLFSFAPNLLVALSYLPFLGEMWYISFLWLLGLTLEYLFFFALAAFSAICTGNRFAMATVYTLINFLSMVIYWFVMTFYEPLLYGLHIRPDGFIHFCPVVQIAASPLFTFERNIAGSYTQPYYSITMADSWWYLAVVGVLGIALLAVALLLYRHRKLETAGNFLAFSRLKPVFCVVFTLSTGALFEMLGVSLIGGEYIFLVVGIVVGFFVSQMLLQRTLRVFRPRAFGGCAIIGGALVLSILLTALDPLGITRWTPEPDQVRSAKISDSYYYEDYFARQALTLTSPGDIEALVEAHRLILAEDRFDSSSHDQSIHITYTLSDGRNVTRRYSYRSRSEAAPVLSKLFSRPEYLLGYEDWDHYLSQVKSVYMDNISTPEQYAVYYGPEAAELVAAVRADCEAGTMVQDRSGSGVSPRYTLQIETADGDSNFLTVYSDCVNTIRWISAHS